MRMIFAAGAMALAACSAEQTRESDLPVEPRVALIGACAASATSTWGELSVRAESGGDDCAAATVRITISNGADMLMTEDYESAQVMTFADAVSLEDMQRRLGEWITPAGAMTESASDLPAWAATDEQPISGEFPFYVEEGVDRTAYEAARTRDAPLFCYVQGMESLACLVYENGAVTKIGLQSFPG
ncbi:MAG: hypothetical protein K2P58_08265 [Hyphomonadaceae bacterium]|nr:hypothetical protein [Hyphomonadaceae bacterium]